MTLYRIAAALLLIWPSQVEMQGQVQGRVDAGSKAWEGGPWTVTGEPPVAYCMLCHGAQGEGGFGPELAGRGLTAERIAQAVRQPTGVMPAYSQLTDQTVADIAAYLQSLPKVGQRAKPLREAPPVGSPEGQRLFIARGCGQCHNVEGADPRRDLGGLGPDAATFELLSQIVYDGERPTYDVQVPRPNRMGRFSRERLPESDLRTIFRWLTQENPLRVPITAEMRQGAAAGGTVTYTLEVQNEGHARRGLTAEDVTIAVVLPAGSRVLRATGTGYQGGHADINAKADVAIWRVPRIAAGETHSYTLTLAGVNPSRGLFTGSSVHWATPELHRPANQIMRDARIPDYGDDGINTSCIVQRPNGRVLPCFIIPEPQ